MHQIKQCILCKENKELILFHKDKSKPDGHYSKCRECRKSITHDYYKNNIEKITEKSKVYREKNKDKIEIKRKAYRTKTKQQKSIYDKSYYKNNKENKQKYALGYYKENQEDILKMRKQNLKDNVHGCYDKKKKSDRLYRELNRGRTNAIKAKYRATKLQATPKWLTKEHYAEITEYYKEAKKLEKLDGIKRHVDHKYPLQGKDVCGLHVPLNLRILTAKENLIKHNNLPQEVLC